MRPTLDIKDGQEVATSKALSFFSERQPNGALGGLEPEVEAGATCTVLEQRHRRLLVQCGELYRWLGIDDITL